MDVIFGTSWRPSTLDAEWCRAFLRLISNGGTWATTNAIYKVDHTTKTITMILRTPIYSEELHQRNRIAFAQIGWTVLPETGADVLGGRRE